MSAGGPISGNVCIDGLALHYADWGGDLGTDIHDHHAPRTMHSRRRGRPTRGRRTRHSAIGWRITCARCPVLLLFYLAMMIGMAILGKYLPQSGRIPEVQMARKKRTEQAAASQIATGLKAAATRTKPFARSARKAATQGVHKARVWGAPRVERTGQVLQDSVAPKVASALSSAAQRLDPGKRRSGRWRWPAGIATVGAAASTAATVILRRRKPGADSPPAEHDVVSPD